MVLLKFTQNLWDDYNNKTFTPAESQLYHTSLKSSLYFSHGRWRPANYGLIITTLWAFSARQYVEKLYIKITRSAIVDSGKFH